MFSCAVVTLREQKSNVGIAHSTRGHLGRSIQINPNGRQDVGGSGLRGHCAVAVFGHGNATGRCDQRGGRGDVECSGTIAAGAASIDGTWRGFNFQAFGAHDASCAG